MVLKKRLILPPSVNAGTIKLADGKCWKLIGPEEATDDNLSNIDSVEILANVPCCDMCDDEPEEDVITLENQVDEPNFDEETDSIPEDCPEFKCNVCAICNQDNQAGDELGVYDPIENIDPWGAAGVDAEGNVAEGIGEKRGASVKHTDPLFVDFVNAVTVSIENGDILPPPPDGFAWIEGVIDPDPNQIESYLVEVDENGDIQQGNCKTCKGQAPVPNEQPPLEEAEWVSFVLEVVAAISSGNPLPEPPEGYLWIPEVENDGVIPDPNQIESYVIQEGLGENIWCPGTFYSTDEADAIAYCESKFQEFIKDNGCEFTKDGIIKRLGSCGAQGTKLFISELPQSFRPGGKDNNRITAKVDQAWQTYQNTGENICIYLSECCDCEQEETCACISHCVLEFVSYDNSSPAFPNSGERWEGWTLIDPGLGPDIGTDPAEPQIGSGKLDGKCFRTNLPVTESGWYKSTKKDAEIAGDFEKVDSPTCPVITYDEGVETVYYHHIVIGEQCEECANTTEVESYFDDWKANAENGWIGDNVQEVEVSNALCAGSTEDDYFDNWEFNAENGWLPKDGDNEAEGKPNDSYRSPEIHCPDKPCMKCIERWYSIFDVVTCSWSGPYIDRGSGDDINGYNYEAPATGCYRITQASFFTNGGGIGNNGFKENYVPDTLCEDWGVWAKVESTRTDVSVKSEDGVTCVYELWRECGDCDTNDDDGNFDADKNEDCYNDSADMGDGEGGA